jgi:predicted MFS family arabinose efflux permease
MSGQEGLTGWLMAMMGVGAIIGSIWAGARASHIAPAVGLRVSTALYAACMLPMAFLPAGPWLMLQILIAWAVLGPAQVFYVETIDIVRPRGAAVAAMGTLWMIEGSAAAVGNAIGGIVAEWVGPQSTLALASLLAVASPLILTVGLRGVLKPATVAPPRMAA